MGQILRLQSLAALPLRMTKVGDREFFQDGQVGDREFFQDDQVGGLTLLQDDHNTSHKLLPRHPERRRHSRRSRRISNIVGLYINIYAHIKISILL